MDVAIIPVAVIAAVFVYFEIKKRSKKQPIVIKNTITETATVLKVEKSWVQNERTQVSDDGTRDFELTLRVINSEFGERNIAVKQRFKYWAHPKVGDVVDIAVEVDDINKAVILFDNDELKPLQ